jgi:hypothetical protein
MEGGGGGRKGLLPPAKADEQRDSEKIVEEWNQDGFFYPEVSDLLNLVEYSRDKHYPLSYSPQIMRRIICFFSAKTYLCGMESQNRMKRFNLNRLAKRDHRIVLPNFFGNNKHLEAWQLGWDTDAKIEAKSSVSRNIFEFYIAEMGMNLIFYYLEDNNFYGIHAEICPTPFFRFKKVKAEFIYDQLGETDTHDYNTEDVLFWIENKYDIWDTVKINGKSLEEVIQNSFIVSIN